VHASGSKRPHYIWLERMAKSISKIRNRLIDIDALYLKYRYTEPVMELIYRDLFLRELKGIGIEDDFYPVGSSGNHGLLYLIARCLRNLPIQHVFELGTGQSTLLISKIRAALHANFEVTSIEHDPAWVRDLEPHVCHRIVHAPLKPRAIEAHQIEYCDHPSIAAGPPIDFLIIDGPPVNSGSLRFNRMGCLEIIEKRVKDDFVIVIDDTERKAKQALARRIRAALQQRGCDYQETGIRAVKTQIVLTGGRLRQASCF
jgi:hypothetical protein